MKIYAFEVREDELQDFENVKQRYDVEITTDSSRLDLDNIDKVKGYEAITILGHSYITREVVDKLVENGVKYVSTRTIGYNHIDVQYAKEAGLKVSNSGYAPNGVAEYTVMLMLMTLRNYKASLYRGNCNDYSLKGLQGRELRNMTVGVIGTGRIGSCVIENLKGFGCKILAYDHAKKNTTTPGVKYAKLDELLRNSDIITLHTPLTDTTYHMINRRTLAKMKDGVIIINCARGELMDVDDVIEAIENQKIGGMGLDVFEKEEGIYHEDRRSDIISNKEMAYIRQFPNVVMTQHMAFYTDTAVSDMVDYGVKGLVDFAEKGTCDFKL